MAQCRISYDQNGVAKVVDESGAPSKLYGKILSIVKDQDIAINAWSAAVDPKSGLSGENTTVTSLMNFMDSTIVNSSNLTSEELLDVKNIMSSNGFDSMADLNSALISMFKPQGYIEMPEKDTSGRNLYTKEDLESLDLTKVDTLIRKMQGHLLKNGDVFAQVPNRGKVYIDSSKKNSLGMSEKVSDSEIRNYLIENIKNFQDEAEIDFVVRSSPFLEFVDNFEKGGKFRKDLLSEMNDLRRIPTLSMVAGELTADNMDRYITIKNTIMQDLSTTELEADMEYIAGISEYVWRTNPETVEKVVKEVESSMAEYNIDIVGLSNHIGSKEVILDILNEAYLMMKQPTHKNIKSFTDKFDQLVPPKSNSVVEVVDQRYETYNIVHLESTASEAELFNKFGLIRIGEDMYHKVDMTAATGVIMDYLARNLVEGDYSIPSEFMTATDMNDKVRILEDITTYLGTQKVPQGVMDRLKYTAYREAFGHSEVPMKIEEAKNLVSITTDANYLKSGFVTDFYNYILEEKTKDSPLYRDVLSHFVITDKDISLKGRPKTIEGIKYQNEMYDYIKLKRGSQMRYLIEEEASYPLIEDLVSLNFPETVREIDGEYSTSGQFIVRETTPNEYTKLSGVLYRKAGTDGVMDVYAAINTPIDTTYYTNSNNFSLDNNQVQGLLRSNRNLNVGITVSEEASMTSRSPMFGQARNIEDYSTILDSQLSIVSLYNTAEQQLIIEKIDECAG